MPGTIVFFSRVTSEFGRFDDALKSHLASLRNATVKTPSDIEGYDAGLATLDKLWSFLNNADAVIHLVGTEMGAEPPSSMIDEFLARHGEIRSWFKEERLDFGTWTYTQWEAYLAKFRQHQSGGDTPLVFVCVNGHLN